MSIEMRSVSFFEITEMRKIITVLFVTFFAVFGANSETCTIPSTGHEGNCVPLSQCPSAYEALKSDRTKVPVVCDKRLRTICCPLQPLNHRDTVELGLPETQSINNQQFRRLEDACSSYRSKMTKNITVASFIIGEPAGYQAVNYCNINHRDIGVAVEKEFPHVAYIHGRDGSVSQQQVPERKCSGSLISEYFVLTSALCVSNAQHSSATVYFGVLNLTTDFEFYRKFDVQWKGIETFKELTLLKLPLRMELNEMIMPACLSTATSEKFILTGWTGYRFECNPLIKKWYVQSSQVMDCKKGHLCIHSDNVINYHEMLLIGSQLLVHHPDNECQYVLKGIFKRIFQNNYEFINLDSYLPWIESRLTF